MSHFNSKEDYLRFIAAWKFAANHENNKKQRIVCDHTQYCWNGFTEKERAELTAKGYKVDKYSYTIPDGGHCKTDAWLTGSHFILRNVLLGKEPTRGFHPKGERKLGRYEDRWLAFKQAAATLEMHVRDAKTYLEKHNGQDAQVWIDQGQKKGFFLKKETRNEEEYYGMLKSRYARRVIEFLEPLQGAIRLQDLAELSLDELQNARKVLK